MRKHDKEIYCFHPSPSWVIPKTFCRNLSALIGCNCFDPQHLGCNHARAIGPGSPIKFRSGLLIPTWSMSEVYFLTVPSQLCLAMDFTDLSLPHLYTVKSGPGYEVLHPASLVTVLCFLPKGGNRYSLILAWTRPLETWFTCGVFH